MAQHNDRGNEAERLAAEWLVAKGYEFIQSNYRYRHAEIDLIMKYKGILIFVEIKFRSGTGYGFAEEFVDYKKSELIISAADHYVHEKDWHKDIRFDIIAVYKDQKGNVSFKHFEDAFY
ncbi:YraN family protein [Anditalea andensis]|uniref:UPF0102 protein EL17_14495 n=1 Tax=Anditalea andensis TaxID=1048983 RepID=A0A074KYX7_9BACT|nr:YraN family protein [Anditalea andensis]KEO72833.1 endonuclease [Anditalea andensis]